jgi:hypothetical protein
VVVAGAELAVLDVVHEVSGSRVAVLAVLPAPSSWWSPIAAAAVVTSPHCTPRRRANPLSAPAGSGRAQACARFRAENTIKGCGTSAASPTSPRSTTRGGAARGGGDLAELLAVHEVAVVADLVVAELVVAALHEVAVVADLVVAELVVAELHEVAVVADLVVAELVVAALHEVR